jgi:hypothetical protein
MTLPIAAALAVFGLAIDAQPANAFITAADQCGSYLYGYTWWSDEAFNEWEQRGTTSYFIYARDQSFYYSSLFTGNNC